MWLQKHLPRLQSSWQAVVVVCPLEYGVSHLIHELKTQEKPVVWLELSPGDQDDLVSIGNKLAEAVNDVFDTQLLSTFSYDYTLALLQTILPKIGPITLAVTNAHIAPSLAPSLLKLHGKDCQVFIQSDKNLERLELPPKSIVFTRDDLLLQPKEALELANKQLAREKVLKILKEADGAYDLFLSKLNKVCKLPPHLIPGPTGQRTLRGFELEVKPESLLKVFIRKQRWIEALELSVEVFPSRVPEILEEAGYVFHEQGAHKRLFHLLEGLAPNLKMMETVLYWRLQAAFRLGQESKLRKEVEDYLKKNEAPELRALAAGVFVPTNRKEALRAYRAKKTPFTAFQLGWLTDTKQGIPLLRESIELAKSKGKPYELARNMATLAAKLIFQGFFQEGVSWAEHALKTFDQLGIKDGQRRLFIVNDWAHGSILNGDLAGLEPLLKENEAQLATAYPDLALLFRSTLADYYVATNQSSKALDYYQKNLDNAPQDFFSHVALDIVPVLMELEKTDEAKKVALRAKDLTKHLPDAYNLRALLAYAITIMPSNPILAQKYLIETRKGFIKDHDSRRTAQASLYLALSYLQNNDPNKSRASIHDRKSHVINLSQAGLRLLSGPESIFRPVWSMLSENKPASLEIRFLGKKEVWLEGQPLKLFPSWLEILAVLAIEQRPLTIEELMSCLYGDGGSKNTLKSNLAKMRRVLPISQHPYHIQGSFQADFIDVAYYVRKGNFSEAIKLYEGPLLKASDAPCIRAKDEELSESLCNYALENTDIEALLRLSELLPDDLRLLDRLFNTLDKSDPRAPNVRARVEQIRNSWMDVPSRKRSQKTERQRLARS
jgi:tetratricopeptide (TPR) repeat protein